jgi:deazaflavin-dependent oxidoreductase (nitroreductase family)
MFRSLTTRFVVEGGDMTGEAQEPVYAKPDLSLVGTEHVEVYRETNGERGYDWNGTHILLLTTKGRISGEARTTPIIFNQDGSNYFIIASTGGAPSHPKWYLNLVAEPRVQIQIKGDHFEAMARTTDSPERERLWNMATKTWPNYDVYATRTTRKIPVVVLELIRF